MKEQILKFLQNDEGSNSSRRLIGFEGYQVFLILSIIGCLACLFAGEIDNFIKISYSILYSVWVPLGLIAVEKFKGK